MADNPRSRAWCFTVNNWTPEQYDVLLGLNTTYIIIGKEVGEGGTPHLQGYAYFTNQVYYNTLRRKVSCFWQVARGTPAENIAYCSKEGDFYSRGDAPTSRDDARKRGGEATKEKWEGALDNAKKGLIDDIPADIVIKHYSAIQQIAKDHIKPPPDLDDVTGFWFYGEAGCGKSYFVRQNWPDSFLKNCNKWWDGYKQQDSVIIDDFDKAHHVLGHYLKIWGDRYGFTPEVKCSVTTARPKFVVVTSNYHPRDIWDDNRTLDPILRRYYVVKCWKDAFGYHRTNEGRVNCNGRRLPDVEYERPSIPPARQDDDESEILGGVGYDSMQDMLNL
jgi:hypothetical protein